MAHSRSASGASPSRGRPQRTGDAGSAAAAWWRWCVATVAFAFNTTAFAAPVALSDEELSKVDGRDGVGLAVHLELNSALLNGTPTDSRLMAGFNVNGTKTYAVVQNLAGVMDLVAVTLNVRTRTDGGDTIDIGLPGFVGFTQFGFRALAAQSDPLAPIAPGASYGQLLLNGTGTMTGHVYLWAQ